MKLTSSHTYVTLELSETAYQEIRSKLLEAGYYHCFDIDDKDKRGAIDMPGLAVIPESGK